MKTKIIGIAGGTGSGKSTIAKSLLKSASFERAAIIKQDNYYKDQSHLPYEERVLTNYDHPFAFDNDLLIEHLTKLRDGESIDMPEYDFKVHNRKEETIHIEPRDIIILEGILIFFDEAIRDLLDIKVFVDTDSDVRIIRRILRDMKERQRSMESVIEQYLTTVRPAHLQFVEPSKRYADIIIPEGGKNLVALDLLSAKIDEILSQR